MSPEREITAALPMCGPHGRVNEEAIGWTRWPLHQDNLGRSGRTKRWERWGVVTDRLIVMLAIEDYEYLGFASIYVLDRLERTELRRRVLLRNGSGLSLTEHCGTGESSAKFGGVHVRFVDDPTRTRLVGSAPGVLVELDVAKAPNRESLGALVPLSPGRFRYGVKDVGRPVCGAIILGGQAFSISEGGGYAVLDHGRGRWPYRSEWVWAIAHSAPHPAGRASGEQVGFALSGSGGCGDNAVFVNGGVYPLAGEMEWHLAADPLVPARLLGGGVDLTFTPFYHRADSHKLLMLRSDTRQRFGVFSGVVPGPDGASVEVAGLTGWMEEATRRW